MIEQFDIIALWFSKGSFSRFLTLLAIAAFGYKWYLRSGSYNYDFFDDFFNYIYRTVLVVGFILVFTGKFLFTGILQLFFIALLCLAKLSLYWDTVIFILPDLFFKFCQRVGSSTGYVVFFLNKDYIRTIYLPNKEVVLNSHLIKRKKPLSSFLKGVVKNWAGPA